MKAWCHWVTGKARKYMHPEPPGVLLVKGRTA